MSEKDKLDNATRKGRKAFYDGVPLEANPMKATDSRIYWEDAWKAAKEAHDRIMELFNPEGKPNVCISCGGQAIGSKICANCLGARNSWRSKDTSER